MLSNCVEESGKYLGLQGDLNQSILKKKKKKKNQPWILIGETDTEAEAPIIWPPDAMSQVIGKELDAGKDQRQEQKGATEDEMVGWYHRLSGVNLSNHQKTVKDCGTWRTVFYGVT